MTPWEKTLDNFKKAKASGEPYWNAGEMVPVHELLPYREYNRLPGHQEKFPGHFEKVKAYVEQNGIDDMGILMYNPDTHRVYAGEGNTRIAVAKALGFTHVPMRVYRSGHQSRAGGQAPRPYPVKWRPSRLGAGTQVRDHIPADIKPSEIGFNSMKFDEEVPMREDVSIVLREAERILSEEDSFMTKVGNALSTGANNLYTGLRDTGKALMSPAKSSGPSIFGSTASDAFKNVSKMVSAPAALKGKLDTTLQKAASVSATKPMEARVREMIQQVLEGNFDWQELERLYGSDFKPSAEKPKSGGLNMVHPGYPDVADLLVKHGYQPTRRTPPGPSHTVFYEHPDGHVVDVDTQNLEWNHYAHEGEWTGAGRSIGDLNDHLRSFHRAW